MPQVKRLALRIVSDPQRGLLSDMANCLLDKVDGKVKT